MPFAAARREHIAAASDRLDENRIRRIAFDLPAQTADLSIDAAIENRRRAPFVQVQELIPRENPPGSFGQHLEQIELARSQSDLVAVGIGQAALRNMQSPAGESQPIDILGCQSALEVDP